MPMVYGVAKTWKQVKASCDEPHKGLVRIVLVIHVYLYYYIAKAMYPSYHVFLSLMPYGQCVVQHYLLQCNSIYLGHYLSRW